MDAATKAFLETLEEGPIRDFMTKFLESGITDPAGMLGFAMENMMDPPVPSLMATPTGMPMAGAENNQLIETLEELFNPILALMSVNESTEAGYVEACSEDGATFENGPVFDNDTRKAQLVSLAALLISRNANSPDYQAYKQAAEVKKAMKLKIQSDNNAAAIQLADAYLTHVQTKSQSPGIRAAAASLTTTGAPMV